MTVDLGAREPSAYAALKRRVRDAGLHALFNDAVGRNHAGSYGIDRSEQLFLNDLSDLFRRLPSGPQLDRAVEPLAFPPVGITSGQVKSALVGSGVGFSDTVGCHE